MDYLLFNLDLGGNDYTGIPSMSSINIPVNISNDSVFELTEMFNATLSFPGDPIPRVTLSQDSALVTIFDDDG